MKKNFFAGLLGLVLVMMSLMNYWFNLPVAWSQTTPLTWRLGQGVFFVIVTSVGIVLMALADNGWWQAKGIKPRPIVRVWEHDGAIRVVPNLDWDLWHQLYERDRLAGLAPSGVRPDPNVSILFSDCPTDWKTGEKKECEILLNGCCVEKSEMYVPVFRRFSVDFPTAWKLIHGPDAKPLEITEPPQAT